MNTKFRAKTVRGYRPRFEKGEETRITVRDRNSRENWVNRKASKQTEFDTEKRTQGGKKVPQQEETHKLTEVYNVV